LFHNEVNIWITFPVYGDVKDMRMDFITPSIATYSKNKY